MKKWLTYMLSWPRRWWHRHGFGVQSPWAYEFVTDVLFDRNRFYAFDQLGGDRSDEQLFKICRWLKATDVVAQTDNVTAKAYLVYNLRNAHRHNRPFTLYYYDATHLESLAADLQANRFDANSCVILEDIRRKSSALWTNLLAHPSVTSTFELPHRGIAFFDPARQRQNYLL